MEPSNYKIDFKKGFKVLFKTGYTIFLICSILCILLWVLFVCVFVIPIPGTVDCDTVPVGTVWRAQEIDMTIQKTEDHTYLCAVTMPDGNTAEYRLDLRTNARRHSYFVTFYNQHEGDSWLCGNVFFHQKDMVVKPLDSDGKKILQSLGMEKKKITLYAEQAEDL